jgi:hypothetical protein
MEDPPVRRLWAVLLVVAASRGWAADYPKFTKEYAGAAIDPESSLVVWRDEFDTLQATRVGRGSGPWFPGVHAVLVAGEKMAMVPDPAYEIDAGVLRMSTRVDTNDGKRVEAHLQTDNGRGQTVTLQNGYVEARMWLPKARGSHAGLWLLSQDVGQGHTEVDVVETYGAGDFAVHSSTHIWPVPRSEHQSTSNYSRQSDIFDAYHAYGLLATDSEFRFYFDRKEIGRIARLPEQRVPLYLLLSVFGNPTQPLIEQPAVMLVDYVRIYALGGPLPPTNLQSR